MYSESLNLSYKTWNKNKINVKLRNNDLEIETVYENIFWGSDNTSQTKLETSNKLCNIENIKIQSNAIEN